MELALYCPVFGYYEAEGDRIGADGDFYTSISAGSLFGELLACQFSEWLGAGPARLIEAGAHRAELAKDILVWLRANRPALFDRLTYIILEPSQRRREWQRTTLADLETKVEWGDSFEQMIAPDVTSEIGSSARSSVELIFSNELLDALPVHRLGWDARERTWFEWGVTFQKERFVWQRLPKQSSEAAKLLQASGHGSVLCGSNPLTEVLPDGFILEVCPAALMWWRQAAAALRWGRMVTIDYGLTLEEFLRPERPQGTLRAYFHQSVSADLLANPGRQDLTAHVNFSSLRAEGEAAGLKTECFVTQAQFLTGIAARTWSGEAGFGEWTSERKRQFQSLTHPEYLGRAFRVLVQSREAP